VTSKSPWVVHKFGGTSVASSDRYKGVAAILEKEDREPGTRKAVVVSAMSGVTDALIGLVDRAARRDESYKAALEELRLKHLRVLAELLPGAEAAGIAQAIDADFNDIKEVLRGIWHSRSREERVVELVSGHGELWSARLLDGLLRSQGKKSVWLDARAVLVAEPGETGVGIDWETSGPKLSSWLSAQAASADIVVITGFIASTKDGIPTTLRRNGSDYSASIFGAFLRARHITIWTDVDGVLSADPRLVPEAVVLDELSYHEATELAYFGAKVVHPNTMAPAIRDRIPILIRNTFRAELPGTRIHEQARSALTVKGFATIDRIALVNVEGTGMIGVPGVAQRLFGALREAGLSVVMISQASSEHSICFAIPEAQAVLAKATVEKAFFAELHHQQIQTVDVTPGCAVLAAVGDNMVSHPGVAAKFFSALGRAGVNVRAIAQGSSERNISAVIDGAEARKALRAVHSGFYLSRHTLSIGVIGTGGIGGTLLAQLQAEGERLRERFRLDLRVRAIAGSKRMVLDEAGIGLAGWEGAREARGVATDLDAFAAHVQADHIPHAVIVDCTSSEEVARRYPDWLERGIHVVTPNKKASTGSMDFYRRLRAAALARQRHYLYETTVGAGLPIINTLRELVRTGDQVLQIDGVLSGTLSFLFNSFDGTRPFSEIVREAKAKGYTEPDPRDDLSGKDVARKLVILARELGLALELDDVRVEGLVPAKLQGGTADEYLARLPLQDEAMQKLFEDARGQGEVLRYVGVIDAEGRAVVELRRYRQDHPFARIRGSDNIVAFRTRRYDAQPLIVQGPGAGPEVTAGGVFADLLRLSSYLGALL
jgi:aspartokinase/homoserine dehydrogenase 1